MANIILYAFAYVIVGFFGIGTAYGVYVLIRDDRRNEKKRKEELKNQNNE